MDVIVRSPCRGQQTPKQSWTTADGRQMKMLDMVDVLTRERPAIEIDRSIDAGHVIGEPELTALRRGTAPPLVRFDNGPESVAQVIVDRCRLTGTEALFVDPGSPWHNGWTETFNGRLRHELLNPWRFDPRVEAHVIIEDWGTAYNLTRPHTAHDEPARILPVAGRS